MCGIAGTLITKRNLRADDFISNSFVAGMLRGTDSSGIASIDMKAAEYSVHKLPVSGQFFISDNVTQSLMLDACAENVLTICHVRAATVGKVSISNAHPFTYQSDGRAVIGVHNGTLTGWTSKPSARSFTVDSEWAIHHIAEERYDAFEDFTGAYCFVWWDSDEQDILNIARNKERPMHVAFLEDGGMAFASEAGMLFWLLERNSMKISGKILELDEGQLYKFPRQNPKEFTKTALPQPVYSYRGTSYYNNTNTNYALTTVQLVENLIKESTKKPAGAAPNEIATAREYGWLGQEVEFTPIVVSNGEMEGIAESDRAEFDAVVRGDVSQFNTNHTWHCRVIGVIDNLTQVELILGRPFKTTPSIVTPLVES